MRTCLEQGVLWVFLAAAGVGLCAGIPAGAQAPDTPPSEDAAQAPPETVPEAAPAAPAIESQPELSWLQWLGGQLGFSEGEDTPPPALQAAPSPEKKADEEAQTAALAEMQRQMAEMRKEMQQLAATLDLLVGRIMVDLEEENAQLRSEVLRLHARLVAAGLADDAYVPRPGGDLINQILSTAPMPMPPGTAMPAEGAGEGEGEGEGEGDTSGTPAEFKNTVVQEWGRSPAVAAELGSGASSLKGMVCVVPPGSARENLEQLGRDLRAQFADYDNINIEVFDDEAAAQDYADRQVADPNHRVLSISKYKAADRDVILFFENGVPIDVRM